MGLLDDAIREHLDLKRRRGADPGEIERAEREALGPVRREPFALEGDELEPAPGASAYDQEEEVLGQQDAAAPFSGERDWGDAFEEEPELPAGEGEEGDQGLDDATRVMGRTPFEDDLLSEDEPSGPPPYSAGPAGDETMAYDIDEAIAAEEGEPRPGPAEGEADPLRHPADQEARAEMERSAEPQPGPEKQHGEDVLEETPDFLQDTPDHDRLWFEQRPPRDFDFDD